MITYICNININIYINIHIGIDIKYVIGLNIYFYKFSVYKEIYKLLTYEKCNQNYYK